MDNILNQIIRLPESWHLGGSLHPAVLRAIAKHIPGLMEHSCETGTGKSTLILSHLSKHHLVFTIDDKGAGQARSLQAVQESGLLKGDSVTFVLGPTQQTIPHHKFVRLLDLAFIDGPHGWPFPDLEYYFIYPHIRAGGLLIVDDIHIPTITRMFEILREDQMWNLVEVVKTTAFFRRTEAEVLNPVGDHWWVQGYNKARFPRFEYCNVSLYERAKAAAPAWLKETLKTRFR